MINLHKMKNLHIKRSWRIKKCREIFTSCPWTWSHSHRISDDSIEFHIKIFKLNLENLNTPNLYFYFSWPQKITKSFINHIHEKKVRWTVKRTKKKLIDFRFSSTILLKSLSCRRSECRERWAEESRDMYTII